MLGTVRLCNDRSYTKTTGEKATLYQILVEFTNDNNEEYIGAFYKGKPYEIGETVNIVLKSTREFKPYATIE